MSAHIEPVWVQISTTQPVIERGLRSMLATAAAPFPIVATGEPLADPDVVLFDVIHMQHGDTDGLDRWIKDTATTVIAIDRTLRPALGAQARTHGVEWSIDLGVCEEDLVQVITEAIAGHLEESAVVQEWSPIAFLGQDAGLSRREADVLQLVVGARSNQEIADELFLSINSVKTYIRSAYRKIGVVTRSQAVAWAIQAGFRIEPPPKPVEEPLG